MSFQLPLFAGSASSAQAVQADLDARRLQVQISATRNRIALDARKAWGDVHAAQALREVARLDLEVTRERLSVALAQFEEGRLPMSRVEELRSAESEKWLAFYDAQQAVERARIDLLRVTGSLMAALR
jgi:outer membrane protein TolC